MAFFCSTGRWSAAFLVSTLASSIGWAQGTQTIADTGYRAPGLKGEWAAKASGSIQDLTGSQHLTSVTGGLWLSDRSDISFYPIVGWQKGDHQRAQQLIRFKTAQDGTISETGLSIDSYLDTGKVLTFRNATSYSANDLIASSNQIYRVLKGGVSGVSGAPAGTDRQTSGTLDLQWAAHGEQNAKIPLLVQTAAGPAGGNVWSAVFNTMWTSGWRAQFGASVEIDATNNSGQDCPTCSGLFVANGGGANRVGSGITIFGSKGRTFLDAMAIGANAAFQSDWHSFSHAAYGVLDNGQHDYGLYLNGAYRNQAAFFGGRISPVDGLGPDQGQVMLSPTDGANRLQLGYVFEPGGKDYGRIQASNGTSATPLRLNPGGGAVSVGGLLQIAPSTYASLPVCDEAHQGMLAFVTDIGTAATAWRQLVHGGGGHNRSFLSCDGGGAWRVFG